MHTNHVRWAVTAFLPFILLAAGACDLFRSGEGGTDLDLFVPVGDTTRTARVHVPDGISPGDDVRIVIAFHGSNGSGASFQGQSGLDQRAEGTQTVTVYPDAAVGNWAEGCHCNNADRLEIDDRGFVEAVLDSLSDRWVVTPANTFAVGFSQGGLFAYRVACELSDRFRAIASVAAPMSEPLAGNCRPERAVAVLQLHGTADAVLPFVGSSNGALSLLSAPATARFWSRRNRCASEPALLDQDYGDVTVRIHLYGSCLLGREVRLVEVPGYGHGWPTGDVDAARTVLDFFERQAG